MSELKEKLEELTDLSRRYYQCCKNSTGVKSCIKGNEVICSKEKILELLRNKIVTRDWWMLTDTERDALATFVIKNWLFYYIPYKREGKVDCIGGEGEWHRAVCVHNGVIRFLRFGEGEKYYKEISDCYWSKDKNGEHCYWEESFDLPVYPAHAATMAGVGPGFGHVFCAIQIKENMNDFYSWRFFQYDNSDIKIGNWQMPCKIVHEGTERSICVTINKVERLSASCGGYGGTPIARWEIDRNTCKPK